MRVGWVIPCRYVEVNDNLTTIVGGGIDRAWIPEVPAPVQILCAVRIIASHDEVTATPAEEPEHELACRIHDPSMNLVSELTQPFGMSGEREPTIEPAAMIPMGVAFEPQEEGQHTIEVAVDDCGFSVPFNIIVGPPPEGL